METISSAGEYNISFDDPLSTSSNLKSFKHSSSNHCGAV